MAVLDWSGRDGTRHWGGGTLRPCRSCHAPTLLLDDRGEPQHKTCAEREAAAEPPGAVRAAGLPAVASLTDPDIDLPSLEAEALG